ncbi:DUF805 domain-containing protein [Alloalcanivorax profundimaris]|uniref:DUF805 domain-containing protein n=1 Tax=Alloalcanivorax profundimaris TaxID=2735259 RepID=UPI001888F8C4|nr:DUF805 domain-containing protein [Alloalcanivorax profundimaris]MBF1801517.1 DUF805 domain-containing protein [Alloalcanivorax profundimaris]
MNQPYTPPEGEAGAPADRTYAPRFFALQGRLGRLRYFVYGGVVMVTLYAVLTAVGVVVSISLAESAANAVLMPLVLLMLLACVVTGLIFGKRRLNDLDFSGWWILLALLPLVNLVMAVILLFVPGSKGENRFGPRPAANGAGLVIGAFTMILLVLAWVGLLLAVALPAYQDYAERARAQQFELQRQQQELLEEQYRLYSE